MQSKKILVFLAATFIVVSGFLAVQTSVFADDTGKVLHSFGKGEDGSAPFAGVIFDAAGNLYGTTYAGGAFKVGTVFELTPGANGKWAEKVLHNFGKGKDGATPYAGVIFDTAGNLYGTTAAGGANNDGTVFELTPGANGNWTEKILHSFDLNGKDGAHPRGGLIFDATGSLYGTTTTGGEIACNPPSGCGTVFKLTPGTNGQWVHTGLHSFKGTGANSLNGANPEASLIFDGKGSLYGTTYAGGRSYGTVFELTPGANGEWIESVLYRFCAVHRCVDGAHPTAGLIFDVQGNLYGTTGGGGAYCFDSGGCGTAFQLIPGADGKWTENVLHSFNGSTDGNGSGGDLIFDAAGNLYGTTGAGHESMGTVFRLSQVNGQWTNTVLYNFDNRTGTNPYDGVIFDAAGNLYGTTSNGGVDYGGTVFQITP
jgi:uncharacterized repeat protein (TIGR03803 family)